jgi:hypothetical protein
MRFVLLGIGLLFLTKSAVAGNSGVLLANVPQIENRAAVLGAVKRAFISRRWTIVESDESSVTATIARRATTSRMQISISGLSLMYDETSTRLALPHGPTPTAPSLRNEVKLDGWLENIRRDVRANVASIPLQGNAPSSVGRTAAERLKTLDELRSSGTITEDEYAKKRAAILDAL